MRLPIRIALALSTCLVASAAESTDLSQWTPLKSRPNVLVYAKGVVRNTTATGEPTVRVFAMWNLLPVTGSGATEKPSVRVEFVIRCKSRQSMSKAVFFELHNLQGRITHENDAYSSMSAIAPQSVVESIADQYCS